MTDYESIDYFTDAGVLEDPFPYLEYLRAQCPVVHTGHRGMVAVTGCEEAAEVFRDNDTYSACNVTSGPFLKLPVPLEGDQVGELIEEHRNLIPQNDLIVTMDPPVHTRERALLMRLFTPKRLQENEAFMLQLAERQLDQIVGSGHCEFVGAYAKPYSMLVIADLLGVPEEDHDTFREGFGLATRRAAELGLESATTDNADVNTLSWLYEWFSGYIQERRRAPKNDVLTDLALAKYADGTTPELMAVVHQSAFLFTAGRETTSDLIATAVKYLAEDQVLQNQVRTDPGLIPGFIEECLRIDSPIRVDFRLAKRDTVLGGVQIAAGATIAMFLGAVNRDPRRFDSPTEFSVDRANLRQHLAFGRGVHTCPGAPLARAEGRVSIERILARTRNIRLSEAHHGPKGARHFDYQPALNQRSLRELHIEFDLPEAK
jgi:cytochrome P450